MHDLERAEQRLIDSWLAPVAGPDARIVIGGGTAEVAPPGDEPADVTLRLLDLAPAPPLRGREAPALQLLARYVVTAASRHLLADLAFAAMALPPIEVERSAPAAGEAAEAPRFVVRVPVPRAVPARRVPRVRHPLESSYAPLRPHTGIVVAGPDDTPIAGALVELPAHGWTGRSGLDGTFHLAALPSPAALLRVEAKGCVVTLPVGPDADVPLIVRLPLPET